jgi:hypothetical protein
MKAINGDHGGNVLDGGEVVFVGLGGVDSKIEHGGRFCLVKPKSECSGLSIGGQWNPLPGTMVVAC